jgi:ubiquinone/menaquinone biosynthesis C-methylase UbiE
LDTKAIEQRAYYARTAEHYDAMHIRSDDEHGIALAAFVGLARLKDVSSILDVGAGTGRALQVLQEQLGDINLMGVEPVKELRQIAYERGISPSNLVEGDALALPFSDNAFDFVIETGVLHHLREPSKAVKEMVRVAKRGVMISDCNKFGQGSRLGRRLKGIVRFFGLWNLVIWVQTRGTMTKCSKNDGVFYSYSVFDDYQLLTKKFPRIFVMNSTPLFGTDLRVGTSHVVVFALEQG